MGWDGIWIWIKARFGVSVIIACTDSDGLLAGHVQDIPTYLGLGRYLDR